VGIAGEDDLDAPDLNAEGGGSATASSPMLAPSDIAAASASYTRNGQGSGGYQRKSYAPVRQPVLSPQESARLREGMLAEIECIASPEAATAWANTMLRAKNTLTAEDAGFVERAFETKLGGLASDPASDLVASDQTPESASTDSSAIMPDSGAAKPSGDGAREPGDRNPPITKTVRHRNKEHLRFVRAQPCLICGKQPSDPHHLPFAQPRALGRKVSDQYTVPLCRAHQRELHRAAKEIPWWQSRGIAPLAVAEALWQRSQSGQALIEPVGVLAKPPRKRPRRAVNGSAVDLEKSVAG
jgi:hypothetical protein